MIEKFCNDKTNTAHDDARQDPNVVVLCVSHDSHQLEVLKGTRGNRVWSPAERGEKREV